jgi:hypothetical protein
MGYSSGQGWRLPGKTIARPICRNLPRFQGAVGTIAATLGDWQPIFGQASPQVARPHDRARFAPVFRHGRAGALPASARLAPSRLLSIVLAQERHIKRGTAPLDLGGLVRRQQGGYQFQAGPPHSTPVQLRVITAGDSGLSAVNFNPEPAITRRNGSGTGSGKIRMRCRYPTK